MTPRVPAGVPAGGQFTVAARAEADLHVTDPASSKPDPFTRLGLPDWTPPGDTSTSEGAFSRCKEVSAEYTLHLRAHGIEADWVQTAGALGSFPHADRRWQDLPKYFWQHYLTRVTGPDGSAVYIDWTARQFDPDADHPQVTDVHPHAGPAWESTSRIDIETLEQFWADWIRQHPAADRSRARRPAGHRRATPIRPSTA